MAVKELEKLAKITTAHSGFHRLYDEVLGRSGSFRNDLIRRMNNYHLQDDELRLSGSVKNIAQQYGLARELDNYINQNLIGGLKGKLARTLDHLTSIKDVVDDAESVVAGPLHPVVHFGTQKIYSMLAGILGYASGIYPKSKGGAMSYGADTAKGYAGAAVESIPILGSIVEIGTNLDDKRNRIAEVYSHKAAYWLRNEIRKQNNLPLLSEDDLEHRVAKKGLLGQFQEKVGGLVDYARKVKSRNPVYGSDLSPYAHEVYGRA